MQLKDGCILKHPNQYNFIEVGGIKIVYFNTNFTTIVPEGPTANKFSLS